MAEEQVATAARPPAATAVKKKGKAGTRPKTAKGEKKVASRPSSADMVLEAVRKLAERNGSSLQSIKKFIVETHKVDMAKQNTFIKNAIKKLVETGKLAQTKGTGASGSFKLPAKPKPASEKKAASPAKAVKKTEKLVKPKKIQKKAVTSKPKAPAKPAATTAEKKGKKPAAPKAPKMKLPKTLKKKASPTPKPRAKKAAPTKKQ